MKLSALEPLRDQLVTSLHQVMGSKPNLKVVVDAVRAHGHADDAAEAVVHVLEAGNLGATRKVPASELHAFLTSPASTQALQKLNVVKASEQLLQRSKFSLRSVQWWKFLWPFFGLVFLVWLFWSVLVWSTLTWFSCQNAGTIHQIWMRFCVQNSLPKI